MIIRMFALLAAGLAVVSLAPADEKGGEKGEKTGFIKLKHFDAAKNKTVYAAFVPHNYNERKTPVSVIMFLHGAGEIKGGNKMPVDVGIGTHIRANEKTFPHLVIFPQSDGKDGWLPDTTSGRRAMEMLDDTIKRYKADPKRVYLTGLSMGGGGTWNFATVHPNRWAAIVPICGFADPKAANRIKNIPCWAFHGLDDQVVPASETKEMITALKKAGGKPEVTYYPKTGHVSWDKAYDTPELWKWLADKKRD